MCSLFGCDLFLKNVSPEVFLGAEFDRDIQNSDFFILGVSLGLKNILRLIINNNRVLLLSTMIENKTF